MLATMKPLLKSSLDSYKNGNPFAIGAFNVNTMEQFQGIINAAREMRSPVVVQIGCIALQYAGGGYLVNIIKTGLQENPEIPVAIHLDHGRNFEEIKNVIQLGFTSVMIDGSLLEDGKTPSDFESNIKRTGEVVKYARDYGVSVEGELGVIGGIEDGHGSKRAGLTDPDQAVEFVERTGIDALALSIGTAHGAHKFKGEAIIAFDLIKKIRALLPTTYLVAHGSSSVSQEHIDVINNNGGRIEQAKGVPFAVLKKMVECGINKINVDTDIQLAVTSAIRRFLAENPAVINPRDYLGVARQEISAEIKRHIEIFGSANQAGNVII
jgi:fructose-bisphosphate aldolase class II